MITVPSFIRNLALAAAGALLCSAAAQAAKTGALVDAQARYRQDMADCNSGKSNQDLATCRREARNALAEAKRGGLKDDPAQYQQNAVRRCDAHKGDDRTDCEARMRDDSRIEGSAAEGGILREGVTVVPADK
jgi:hypothetical protein